MKTEDSFFGIMFVFVLGLAIGYTVARFVENESFRKAAIEAEVDEFNQKTAEFQWKVSPTVVSGTIGVQKWFRPVEPKFSYPILIEPYSRLGLDHLGINNSEFQKQ